MGRPEAEGADESAHDAAATARHFAGALLGGDPAAAADYLSPDGQLLTPDGTQVAGREAILGVLSQLTAAEPRLEIRSGRTVISGTIAFCTQYWVRSSRTAPAETFEASHVAHLVLAHGEGGWRIVIAAPWS